MILEQTARTVPERPIIIFEDQPITYGQFESQVNRLGNGLRALGLKKNETAAYYFPNRPETLITEFAFQKLGCVSLPINVMSKADEVKYYVNNSQAVLLVTDERGYEIVSTVRGEMPALRHIVVKGGTTFPDASSYEEIMESSSESLDAVPCHPMDVTNVLYTSGTTGFPKGAMQIQRAKVYATSHMSSFHQLRYGADRFLCPLPVFNNFGLCFSIVIIENAGTILLIERWDTDRILDVMTRHKATYFAGTPTMFVYLMEGFDAKKHRSSLRLTGVGGSQTAPELINGFQKTLETRLVEIYGATELCGFVTSNPPVGIAKFGSAGLPIGDVHISIRDDERQEVPPGEVGEIVVQTDMMGRGYWGDEAASKSAFTEEGWYSGDLGYLDDDGYLYIVDRKKDLIITGGMNIFPGEVENVLLTHPKISLAALIGSPDPVKGELAKAYIVLKEGETALEQEIIDFCRERMAVYKAPRTVEFVDELPLSPVGKVLKRELRDQIAAKSEKKG
jgi:long-chain acyl-CoA synthetase